MYNISANDTFLACDAIAYDTPMQNIQLSPDSVMAKELTKLSSFGFSVLIDDHKINLLGNRAALAALIYNEIDDRLVLEFPHVADYMTLNIWSYSIAIDEVSEIINEVGKHSTFLEVINQIIKKWKLSPQDEARLNLAETIANQYFYH